MADPVIPTVSDWLVDPVITPPTLIDGLIDPVPPATLVDSLLDTIREVALDDDETSGFCSVVWPETIYHRAAPEPAPVPGVRYQFPCGSSKHSPAVTPVQPFF